MRQRVFVVATVAALGSFASVACGQKPVIEPALATLAPGHGLQLAVANRSASTFTDGARRGLHLSEGAGEGAAYLDGVAFANGTIDVDIRGKDAQGQSFVGIAFHGVDGNAYEAVYFRPFNFRTADSTRHAHAVQYVAQPDSPWEKLRAEHPGVYEKPVNPSPDPNGWFHARIVVADSLVSVFVDNATEPSLVVRRLSNQASGKIGLWVGNGSGGDFAKLAIRPK